MNDPYLLFEIIKHADTQVLLNLTRASRNFNRLVRENVGLRLALLDAYAVDGNVKCADGTVILHGSVTNADGIRYWFKNGKLHRDNDEPAVIWPDGTRYWFKNGKSHRDNDQPAVISANGTRSWYKNGELHRDDDKPAEIYANGTCCWYKNEQLQRVCIS